MRYVKKIGGELFLYDRKFDLFEKIYLDPDSNEAELVEWDWPLVAQEEGHRAVLKYGDTASLGNCHRKVVVRRMPGMYHSIMERLREHEEIPRDEIPRIYKRCARCHIWKPRNRGYFNLDTRKVTRYMERCRSCDAEIALKNWNKKYAVGRRNEK